MSRRASRTVPASSQTGKEELYFHKISYSQNVTKKKNKQKTDKVEHYILLDFPAKSNSKAFFPDWATGEYIIRASANYSGRPL